MRKPRKRIALIGLPILQSVNGLCNAAIARYAEAEGNWEFILSVQATVEAFRFLRSLDCDGAIVRLISTAMQREAARLRFPVVNISSWLEAPGVATVRHDDQAAGRLAAEHLLNKGFRRFGCVRMPGGWFIEARLKEFLKTVRARHLDAREFILRKGPPPASALAWRNETITAAERWRFIQWVRELEPPAALMLTDDWDAPVLMDACREAGLEVPRDLVVVSTGVHSEVIDFCRPSLSAVQEDQLTQARLTVNMLDALMAGEVADTPLLEVPPLGVLERESTATLAIGDREVAHALEFIYTHAAAGINVADVVNRSRVSRGTLERHFREITRQTLHDCIVQQRIGRVQEMLLASPPRSLQEIARQCGFPSRRHLNRQFRSVTGQTPAAWRQSQTSTPRGAAGSRSQFAPHCSRIRALNSSKPRDQNGS